MSVPKNEIVVDGGSGWGSFELDSMFLVVNEGVVVDLQISVWKAIVEIDGVERDVESRDGRIDGNIISNDCTS